MRVASYLIFLKLDLDGFRTANDAKRQYAAALFPPVQPVGLYRMLVS